MNRRGISTIELVLVLALGGIVASGVASMLRRQQRFFSTLAMLVEARSSLRDATDILPGELRALTAGDGEVLAFSDSSLEIRSTVGIAIACDTVAGSTAINLSPLRRIGLPQLASYTTTPQPGDMALVFDERSPDSSTDDTWLALDVAAAAPVSNVCVASPLLSASDVNVPRLQLRFTASLAPSVRPGAFVRIVRRVRYRFYRSGTSEWYLGYSEWDGAGYGVVQPVSGPYAPYSRRGTSGLTLRYFDASGYSVTAQTDAPRIVRVDVVVRGASRQSLSGPSASVTDSQAVSVATRNR